MKEFLNSLLGEQNFGEVLLKDWMLKFVSVCLAVLLWYFVGGEDRVDKNVMIPIEIINLPRDLVISNQFKKEIEVTVSGPRSLILEMSKSAITRQVDLSKAVPGTMVIENSNQHIPVPRGIEVQRVQPSSIILSLDKLIQKVFPVTAKTVGRVANGYYLKTLQTDPDMITITGPRTILAPFDELYTKAIDLKGIKKSAQLQVPLELDPSIVDLIGETSVTADLVIGIKTVTKTIMAAKVHVVIDGVLRKVLPETVRVTANIPTLLIDKKNDSKKLFSVTALQKEEGDMLEVKVTPRPDIQLPIEILSIIPSDVLLVDGEHPTSAFPLSETFMEEMATVTMPDMDKDLLEPAKKEKTPIILKAEKKKIKINR